jgi:DNA-directed RNA polymerase specialized sigma subunit
MKKNFNQKFEASDEQIQFITQSVEELPPAENAVIYFHFWGNYTLEEIAFVCGLSQTLIQEIFDEAIHRLRLNYLIEFSIPKHNRGHM